MKKYEMTKETYHAKNGARMFRIQALIDIPEFSVKAGDLGGFIQQESNLSQEGSCWIKSNCHVFGDSEIKESVLVKHGAVIQDCNLSGDMKISGAVSIQDSYLSGNRFRIEDEAILENCDLRGEDIAITGKTKIQGVYCDHPINQFEMSGEARIENKDNNVMNIGGYRIKIAGNAVLQNVWNLIGDDIVIQDDATLEEKTMIQGNEIFITDSAVVKKNVTLYDNIRISECATLWNSTMNFLSVTGMDFHGDIEIDVSQL